MAYDSTHFIGYEVKEKLTELSLEMWCLSKEKRAKLKHTV